MPATEVYPTAIVARIQQYEFLGNSADCTIVRNVGQQNAMPIQMPNGQDILIDGGPDFQKTNLELSEKLPFLSWQL